MVAALSRGLLSLLNGRAGRRLENRLGPVLVDRPVRPLAAAVADRLGPEHGGTVCVDFDPAEDRGFDRRLRGEPGRAFTQGVTPPLTWRFDCPALFCLLKVAAACRNALLGWFSVRRRAVPAGHGLVSLARSGRECTTGLALAGFLLIILARAGFADPGGKPYCRLTSSGGGLD